MNILRFTVCTLAFVLAPAVAWSADLTPSQDNTIFQNSTTVSGGWVAGIRDAPPGIGNAYDALMHGLYALRTLPPEQRDVWRKIFDHYVFCANGDPAAHLPPEAKGVLGPATPELLGRMRATLRQILGKL